MSLIYTTVPLEQIFPENHDNIQYQELDMGDGKRLVLERLNENQCKVVRLISTDCNDYLNPRYQPGSLINLSFV